MTLAVQREMSNPVVVTVKFVPAHMGGLVEFPTDRLIDALARRLDGYVDVEGILVSLRLDEIIVHGNESRVTFA